MPGATIARPPISNERLKLSDCGQVVYELKTPYRDGTTHIVSLMVDGVQRRGVGRRKKGRLFYQYFAINKWDGLTNDQRDQVRNEIALKLHFLDFAKIYFISALHGTGVGEMYPSIHR